MQIVLSERSAEGVPDQAVLSPRTWRVADLATKRAMLLQGLGWGNVPEHLVGEGASERRATRAATSARRAPTPPRLRARNYRATTPR
jgi:DNA-binding transcriptional LysR family regulator